MAKNQKPRCSVWPAQKLEEANSKMGLPTQDEKVLMMANTDLGPGKAIVSIWVGPPKGLRKKPENLSNRRKKGSGERRDQAGNLWRKENGHCF